jgi:PKHD-type hydroxylase
MFLLENPNPVYQWELSLKDVITIQDSNSVFDYVNNHPDNFEKSQVEQTDEKAVDAKERVTDIMWLYDDIEQVQLVYQKLQNVIVNLNNTHFKYNITVLEPLQYSQYDSSQGGHYDWHYDTMMRNPGNNIRKLSFSVGLNSEYEGGELEFFSKNRDVKYKLELGDLVIFPSFIPHKVHPVTSGIRKTLVGWIHGPNFV